MTEKYSLYKTLLLYESHHRLNTLKLVNAISDKHEITMQNINNIGVNPNDYDMIVLASGVYNKKFGNKIEMWVGQSLPANKKVILIYTCGVYSTKYTKSIIDLIKLRKSHYIGEYYCQGFDTHGLLRLICGRSKGHPTKNEIKNVVDYFESICIKEFINDDLSSRYSIIDVDDSLNLNLTSAEFSQEKEKYGLLLSKCKNDCQELLSFLNANRLNDGYSELIRQIEYKIFELSNDIYYKIERIHYVYYAKSHTFRNPETQISLKKLALCSENGYWKFSQSAPNKGFTCEKNDVYENYNHSMETIEAKDKDMMLSFVAAKNLYLCFSFGDQITQLLFDVNNPSFQKIMELPAYTQNNSVGEIKTDFLIPLNSYSISEPQTLKHIVDLSSENRYKAIQTIFFTDFYRDKLERIAKIDSKFLKSLLYIDFIRKSLKNNKEKNDNVKFISDNLEKLTDIFEKQEYKGITL